MNHSDRRNLAGVALLLLVAVASLLVKAGAQELRPKGKIVVQKTLPGSIAFSPDGRYIAVNGQTANFDVDKQALDLGNLNISMNNPTHVILLLEAGTGKVKRQLMKGPEKGLGGLFGGGDPTAFSSDGRLLMAVYDNAIHVWDAEKGKKIGVWGQNLQRLAFSLDRRFALARRSDDTYEAFDLKDGHSLGSFKGETEAGLVPLEPERPSIVFLKEKNVVLKNLRTESETSLGPLAGTRITSAAVSPNGDLLAVVTDSCGIALWSLGENKKLFERPGDGESGAGNPIFSPDNSTLIYAWKDQLAMRSVVGEAEFSVPHGHPFDIGEMVFADALTLATTGTLMDATIKLWNFSPAAGGRSTPGAGPASTAIQQPVTGEGVSLTKDRSGNAVAATGSTEASGASPTASWKSWGILGVQRRPSAFVGMSPGPDLRSGNVYLDVALQLVNASGEKAEFKYPHSGLFLRQISSGQRIQPRDITNEALRKEVESYRQKGLFQNLAKDFVFSVKFEIDPGKNEEFSVIFEVPENAPGSDFELCLPDSQPRSLLDIGPANPQQPRGAAASVEGTTRKPAESDGSRDSLSFTFDDSGKLITVNGKPVGSGAIAPASKSSQEWENLARRVIQLHAQAKFSEALPVAERAVKVAEQTFGPEDINVATSLNSLAVIYNALNKFDAAVPIAQRAVALQDKGLGAEHTDLGNALGTLGSSYSGQERYVEAEETFERAIAVTEKAKGPKDEELAAVYNSLGRAYVEQDKFAEAESAFERALDIMEEKVGPWDPLLAAVLNNLASAKKQMRDYDGALTLYKRSLGVLERGVGKNHPYVAAVLENLAVLYNLKGLTKEAQAATQRAQKIKLKR